jgi:gliding motility-associated-like protein
VNSGCPHCIAWPCTGKIHEKKPSWISSFFPEQDSATAIVQPLLNPALLNTGVTSFTYQLTVWPDGMIGCAVTDSVTVTLLQLPVVTAGNDTSICSKSAPFQMGDSLGFGSNWISVWNPGTGLDDSTATNPLLFSSSLSGSVTFILTVSLDTLLGCYARDTVNVNWETYPQPGSFGDETFCGGDTLQLGGLSAGASYQYQWNPVTGLDNPGIQFPLCFASQSITYIAAITDTTMISVCRTVNDTVTVTVEYCDLQNVVTPNGDGVNDYFIVNGFGPHARVFIYDRWGTAIFNSNAYKNDWPRQDESLPGGVYFYTISGDGWDADANAGVKAVSRSVTLLR